MRGKRIGVFFVVIVPCPNCNYSIDVIDSAKTRIECPSCKKIVEVGQLLSLDRTVNLESAPVNLDMTQENLELSRNSSQSIHDTDLEKTVELEESPETQPLAMDRTVELGDSQRNPLDLDSTVDFDDSDRRAKSVPVTPLDLALTIDEQSGSTGAEPVGRGTDEDSADAPAKKIGKYILHGLLGEGAFAAVHLAFDEQLHRLVAIKVPHHRYVASQKDVETFLNEMRILANLDHPGIVSIYDSGRTDEGVCFYVSKYVEGKNLASKVSKIRQNRLSLFESSNIIVSVAEALEYAHQEGVIHRDVKPSNILMDAQDKPYVTDFGLAIVQEDSKGNLTCSGTPAYMSPEQVRPQAGQRIDARSDIYSLGVVFFELLTGYWPLQADNLEALRAQIKIVEPCPPSQLDATIPKELDRICLKALSKRAEDRYQSAIDMARDIRRWVQMNPQLPPTPSPRKLPKKQAGIGQSVLQAVATTSLPLGHKFRTPLKSMDGELALEKDEKISPDVIERLGRKGISTVWLHEQDAGELGIVVQKESEPYALDVPESLQIKTLEVKRLELEIRRPKVCEIIHTGPAFRKEVSSHKHAPYDPELVEMAAKRERHDLVRLQNLLKEAANRRNLERDRLTALNTMIQSYLMIMRKDRDLLVGSVANQQDRHSIALHSLRLSVLGMAVATEMGYDVGNVTLVGLSGLLHDMGMFKVPMAIRETSPRNLTDKEKQEFMMHVVYAAETLSRAVDIPLAVRIAAFQVHERHNGRGYPRKSHDAQIHPFAKILGAVDAYLAMITTQSFRNSMLPYYAMETMLGKSKNRYFDPKVVRSLLATLSLFPVGSYVLLNDHRAARVIRSNPMRYDRPTIEIICQPDGRPVPAGEVRNLAAEPTIRITQAIRGPHSA